LLQILLSSNIFTLVKLQLTDMVFADDTGWRHFRCEDRHLKILAASDPELYEAAVARVAGSGVDVTSALAASPPRRKPAQSRPRFGLKTIAAQRRHLSKK
jgi:hypothetical protein